MVTQDQITAKRRELCENLGYNPDFCHLSSDWENIKSFAELSLGIKEPYKEDSMTIEEAHTICRCEPV